MAQRFGMRHGTENDSVAWEYAKSKNRPYMRTVAQHLLARDNNKPRAAIAGSQGFEMNDKASEPASLSDTAPAPTKILPAAAQRALAEAEARRAAQAAAGSATPAARELQGPKGPEPTRFGDWERKGIASDF